MHRISITFVVTALALCLDACAASAAPESQPAADAVAPTAPTAQVSVERILKSRFQRVAGPAAGAAVLDVGPPGSWYDYAVVCPTVEYDGAVYRLWFVGLTMTEAPGVPYGWYSRIGMATSRDGVNWKLANGGKPVFDMGPAGSFDAMGVTHPYVLRVDGQYMLWYGGISGELARHIGQPGQVRVERVGLATSRDGVHWQRQNGGKPVMNIGRPSSIDSIQATGVHVLHIDGQFVMWYGAYGGTHKLGLAISPDGVHWTKGNNGQSLPGLAGTQQLGPAVYFDGTSFLMIYNHDLAGKERGTIWAAFAATSADGIHWQPAFDDQPLLGAAPAGNFGTADGAHGNNHSVHPTKLIVTGDRVRIFYFAEVNEPMPGSTYAPQRIGLMEAAVE
jgi:predicted GH43/DUF377 family glycosyl hydrolase